MCGFGNQFVLYLCKWKASRSMHEVLFQKAMGHYIKQYVFKIPFCSFIFSFLDLCYLWDWSENAECWSCIIQYVYIVKYLRCLKNMSADHFSTIFLFPLFLFDMWNKDNFLRGKKWAIFALRVFWMLNFYYLDIRVLFLTPPKFQIKAHLWIEDLLSVQINNYEYKSVMFISCKVMWFLVSQYVIEVTITTFNILTR